MGKTRPLFKKTGGIKGTCHAGMGKTKDKNGLREMERLNRNRRD